MKISIVIPTTNRKEELENSIRTYFNQTYQNFEILVMDNASTDGTGEMVKREFSSKQNIKYYYFNENLYFTAFNIGVWNSTGDIIWVCDDDSYPRDNDLFEKVINIFEKHKDIHIIGTENLEVLAANQIWNWHPLEVDKINVPSEGYKTNTFHGTGAGIRRELFDKLGGFWGFGFEELDFCTKAIVNGYNVRYFPNLVTLHFSSPKMRNLNDRWFKLTTQFVKYNFKYFPFFKALGRVFPVLIYEIIKAVYIKVSPLLFITTIMSWIYTAFHTRYYDFHPVPKRYWYDITLGQSQFKGIINIIKFKFKAKF